MADRDTEVEPADDGPRIRRLEEGEKPKPGRVAMVRVFGMPELNGFKTAFQVFRGPDEYLIHLTDGATGQMVMGFLTVVEMASLRDSLATELAEKQ